ncbi:MAG: 30S ribosome-binding factor RbfA [Planctomycetes bacterium]|nr:30S ribosome-binding factor RbfA [Planctomycetota bacterium]
MPAHRKEKLAKELQRVIGGILQTELRDPRVGFATVTRVVPSVDLQFAKVFVSVLGDEAATKRSLDALQHARGFVKALLEQRMKVRQVPDLLFVHDPSIEGAIRISKLIDEAVGEAKEERDEAANETERDENTEPPGGPARKDSHAT